MNGDYLEVTAIEFLEYVIELLTTTRLFEWNGHWITLWTVCISTISLSIFRDFLDLMGIWSYCKDDEELEYDSYERD